LRLRTRLGTYEPGRGGQIFLFLLLKGLQQNGFIPAARPRGLRRIMNFPTKPFLDRYWLRRCVLKPLLAVLLLAEGVTAFGQSVQYDYTNFVGYPGGAAGTNDGLGTVARFSNPTGIAVDTNGNIFIADQWNALIRKVSPSGMVSTLVGAAAK